MRNIVIAKKHARAHIYTSYSYPVWFSAFCNIEEDDFALRSHSTDVETCCMQCKRMSQGLPLFFDRSLPPPFLKGRVTSTSALLQRRETNWKRWGLEDRLSSCHDSCVARDFEDTVS